MRRPSPVAPERRLTHPLVVYYPVVSPEGVNRQDPKNAKEPAGELVELGLRGIRFRRQVPVLVPSSSAC